MKLLLWAMIVWSVPWPAKLGNGPVNWLSWTSRSVKDESSPSCAGSVPSRFRPLSWIFVTLFVDLSHVMYFHSLGSVPDHGREPEFLIFCFRRFINSASSQWTGRQRRRRGRKRVKWRGPTIFPGGKKTKKKALGFRRRQRWWILGFMWASQATRFWSLEFLKR